MSGRRLLSFAILAIVWLGLPSVARGQQRPLLTEDPETVNAGLILIEGGIDLQQSVFYPVSGLEGDLLRVPVLGMSVGIGSVAEVQVDGGLYNRLDINSRTPAPLSNQLDVDDDDTTDVEDLIVATKVRLVPEGPGHPAIGIRFATRLPLADNESGLGTDTLEFNVSALVGKTVRSIRVVGNVGMAILGDPTRGDEQGDLMTYGFSLARAVRQGIELVGEINGRYAPNEDTPGLESRAAMRLGGRITTGTVRLDAGAIIGLTSRDPSFGFTAGLTWVFKAFTP